MSKTKVPIVAIIGRANVGKSSLFNALVHKRVAIVANEAGTTRDSITAKATLLDKDFWLVDTAGMKTAEDDFELTIQEQIIQASESATLIAVVVEANIGISDEDRRVAKMALKSQKPVILIVNKIDKAKKADLSIFERLGIKNIVYTSTTTHEGFYDLEETLYDALPQAHIKSEADELTIALLGRPNVGKSSLFNALGKKQQAIVSSRAGTTRDINRMQLRYQNRAITILDTAGIRRSGKIEVGIEKFSVLRSLQAIEESDVCLLLVDANELTVALDQKIAGLIKEAGKGLVIVISKWDTVDKDAFTRDAMAPIIRHNFDFVPWASLIFTSSETSQNVSKIFDLVLEIDEARKQRFKTSDLNKWLTRVVNRHPPAGLKNRQPKLRYMIQEDDNPIPAFKIFGTQTKFVHWSYRRYLEREFREQWNFNGTPVQLWLIENEGRINPKVKKPN